VALPGSAFEVRIGLGDENAPVSTALQCRHCLESHAQLDATGDEAPPQGQVRDIGEVEARAAVYPL
jgi:hypothetical protein